MNLNYIVILVGLCFVGAALYIILSANDPNPTNETDPPAVGQGTKIVAGQRIRIQTGLELLNDVNRKKLVRQIHDGLGYSQSAFDDDVMPFLLSFAEFVQLIPASQSHHHAHPGGLLEHSIEVAIIALRRASQLELPANTPTEVRVKLAPAWKFGVLVAAMLHDVGKPLVSVVIQMFEDETSTDSILWNPLFGAMNKHQQYNWYKLEFPDNNAPYREHEKVAFYVFNEVVPFKTRNWLNQTDPNLVESLLVALSNESAANKNSVWHDIISPADQESVANNLRYGVRTRFAAARSLPMIEVMMNALRHMVNERGGFFTTSKDSGAELFYKDDKVYIMSKVLGDRLRSFVRENKMGSIPEDNLRIFSTFHDYCASLRNPMDESKTVWDVRIEMKTGGKTQLQQFTMLVFEASKLFQSNWRPAEYIGAIEPLGRVDIGAIEDSIEQTSTNVLIQPSNDSDDEAQRASQVSQTIETTPITDASESVADGRESGGSTEPHDESDEVTDFEVMAFLNKSIESIDSPIPVGPVASRKRTKIEAKPLIEVQSDELAAIEDKAEQKQHATNQIKPKPKLTQQTTAQLMSGLDAFLTPEDSSKDQNSYRPTNDSIVLKVAMSPPDLDTLARIEANKQHIVDTNVALLEPEPVAVSDDTKISLGRQFINWLQNGILQGTITVNEPNSFVHYIPEGALILTPMAFIQFSGTSGSVALAPNSFVHAVCK